MIRRGHPPADAYLAASGVLQDESAVDEEGDDAERDALVGDHARRMFVLAREMLRISAATQAPDGSGPIKIRIGLHVGPVVAAVVGTRMLRCAPPSPPPPQA